MASPAPTPEALEKIFEKVEQESEKRAAEDELARHRTEDVGELMSSESLKSAKQRRRGSISISRFGQIPDELSVSQQSSSTGPDTSQQQPHRVSSLASQSAFYQSHSKNASRHSFASRASELSEDGLHEEDPHHVTQIHQIAGRKTLSRTVGSLLPRRLSRLSVSHHYHQPSNVITNGMSMVVSVEQATSTVEGPHDGEDEASPIRTPAVVHAPARLHNRQSMQVLKRQSSWREKAKNFTKKFRSKSKPDLSVDSVP